MSTQQLLFESTPAVIDRALDCLMEGASRTVSRAQQGLCALHGHDLLLRFEKDRLSLRCATCGWNTPGWTLETGPTAGDVQRARSVGTHARELVP